MVTCPITRRHSGVSISVSERGRSKFGFAFETITVHAGAYRLDSIDTDRDQAPADGEAAIELVSTKFPSLHIMPPSAFMHLYGTVFKNIN